MANNPSLVDPSGINTNFPVAGQNNSSQGFRDNFTVIKGALNRCRTELTELRNILISEDQPPVYFEANVDAGYDPLIHAQLVSFSERYFDYGTINTNIFQLDFDKGNWQHVTFTQTVNLLLRNFPTGKQVGRVRLWVEITDTLHQIILPNGIEYGNAVNWISGNRIVWPAVGHYLIDFISVDPGSKFWILGIHGLSGSSAAGLSYSLPVASTNVLGGVKVDGITIGITNSVISVIGGSSVSDQSIKQHVSTIVHPMQMVKELRGVHYVLTTTGKPGIGVIAQEIEKVIPEVVETNAQGLKTVNYGHITGLLIECVKDLQQQIQQLQTEIDILKKP